MIRHRDIDAMPFAGWFLLAHCFQILCSISRWEEEEGKQEILYPGSVAVVRY